MYPPMGNPGSASDYCKYLDQFLMVLLETFIDTDMPLNGYAWFCLCTAIQVPGVTSCRLMENNNSKQI